VLSEEFRSTSSAPTSAEIGLKAINPASVSTKWDVPARYGFGFVPWGTPAAATFPNANEPRRESRQDLKRLFAKNIPNRGRKAARFVNVITFSGNRERVCSGPKKAPGNSIIGLNRVKKKIGEDHGVKTSASRLLNSKVTNHDDTCAITLPGALKVVQGSQLASRSSFFYRHLPHAKSWKGDLVRHHPEEYRLDRPLPHRRRSRPHELDGTQEVQWTASCAAFAPPTSKGTSAPRVSSPPATPLHLPPRSRRPSATSETGVPAPFGF